MVGRQKEFQKATSKKERDELEDQLVKATGQRKEREHLATATTKCIDYKQYKLCLAGPTSGRSSEMLVIAVFLCLL